MSEVEAADDAHRGTGTEVLEEEWNPWGLLFRDSCWVEIHTRDSIPRERTPSHHVEHGHPRMGSSREVVSEPSERERACRIRI